MASGWRRAGSLSGLAGAALGAPALPTHAAESPALSAALETSDLVTGHLFNALLYLPVGLLVAAILLESFAQWKKNRDVEPGILFTLFAATLAAISAGVVALAFSPVGRTTGQINQFATWMGVVAAVIAGAFWLKRNARSQKLFSLQPVPALSGRIVVPRTSGQKGLIVGYRIALGLALATAVVGLSEIPLGHAPTKSVAASIRPIFFPPDAPATPAANAANTAAAAAENPAPPPASEVPPSAPTAPALADLLEKRVPSTPDRASTLAATVNSSIEGTLPVSPTPPAPAPAPAVSAAAPPGATVPPEPPPATTTAPATAPRATPPPVAPTTTPPEPVATTPPKPPAATTPVAATPAAAGPKLDRNFFATKIKPVLDSKCASCHGSSKQKGDLRLDSVAAIRAGANGHPVVVPGDLDTSSLYQRLTSTDDEDIMPPKDKGGPLPAPVIAAVRSWILAGADFGDGAAAALPAAGAGRSGGQVDEAKSKNLAAPDPATVSALTGRGAVIRAMSSNGALLDINLSHFEGDRVNLAELSPIAKNVYMLDLTRTRVKDEDLAPISQMTSLTRLELKRNPITDAGLVHLKGLTELESLNLYDTQVTDAGLDHLAGLRKLQKLFLFNTKCTTAGADNLKARIPNIVINLGE